MSEEQPLKIGIIGAGSIVRTRHVPGIHSVEGAKITAVCNSTLESAKTFCRDCAPEAEAVPGYPDLISHPEVDIVWIGTPPYRHSELAITSLRAGKHVFCQARMAMDLAEAELMWEASLSNPELVAALCPPPMGMLADRWMRENLAAGIIGQPHQIVLRSMNAAYLDPKTPPHWRQRYEISGLQTLTFGIYVEVLQRWLGPIRSVSAHEATVTPMRDGYQIEIPDMLHVLCTFDSGVEGAMTFSGVAAHAGGDRLEIFGSEGTLNYDFESDEIRLGRPGEPEMQLVEIPTGMQKHWTVEADFLNAVRNPDGPRPQPDFTEGLLYMRVVQAVQESLNKGMKVRIP